MKNKYVAALLALFLGWLGFHKFYLGKWGQGILYILFMWTFIPGVISIFEGILYVVNTKKWFDITFNADYILKKKCLDNINT